MRVRRCTGRIVMIIACGIQITVVMRAHFIPRVMSVTVIGLLLGRFTCERRRIAVAVRGAGPARVRGAIDALPAEPAGDPAAGDER